jgi:DNA polymerase-3 subunit alpha
MLEKLQEILEKLPEDYRNLLIEELNIITDNGVCDFMPYFLSLKEITDTARSIKALKGPLRGSAGGSLVSYLLGITEINPLQYKLPLKRFMSISRLQRSQPDIDLDYPGPDKRNEINKILFDKYGDRVAFVCTFGMQKLKNSLLDGWRICIVQPTELKIKHFKDEGNKVEMLNLKTSLDKLTKEFNTVRKSLGNCPVGYTDLEWLDGCIKDEEYHPGLLETNAAFREWTAKYPQVLETAKSILAIPRQIGQHAAGVVIADVPLYEIVPVMKIDGFNVIAYDKKTVQKLGLIKFDNLGLTCLNFIGDTLEKLEKKGIHLDPWNLPDVPEVYNEYIDGNCRTLFQFDTVGGAGFAKKMKPKSKNDLFAAVALNRPGALDARIKTKDGKEIVAADAYIQRMHGDLDVEYLHDDLKIILKDTYGIYCYQEQVAKTIQEFLGYSEEEADTIRGAISDKNPKAFEEIKKRLPMLIARGWTQEQADSLYETLLAFARYSFNLSHSVGYGLMSYTTAYLKHFYPLEWWTSVLTHSKPDEVTEKYWPEIYHLIDEPNVNVAKPSYELVGGRIVPPLNLVNGIGAAGLQDICSKAPFASFDDFMARIDSRKTNKRVVINLLKSGAMNVLYTDKSLGLKDKVMQYLIEKAKKERKKKIEDTPEELKNLNPYKEYLISKDVFPVSTLSLTDAILKTSDINKPFVQKDGKLFLRGKLPLLNGDGLNKALINNKSLEETLECVAYGYVIAVRKFSYHSEKYDMDKSALELILDFDGHQIKTVSWPRKADVEPILSKFIKEKTVYLFNIKISSDDVWKFSIAGVDSIKEVKDVKIQENK